MSLEALQLVYIVHLEDPVEFILDLLDLSVACDLVQILDTCHDIPDQIGACLRMVFSIDDLRSDLRHLCVQLIYGIGNHFKLFGHVGREHPFVLVLK